MTSLKNLLQTFLPLKPYSKGFVKPTLVACALSFLVHLAMHKTLEPCEI